MTFDECHDRLVSIRRKQGTRHPRVRIDCGEVVYRGRIARSDSDPEHRPAPLAPQGVLILEDLKVGRAAQTIVAIDAIDADGIREIDAMG
ncbi:hypothetical protein BH23PLA1_BH23PLA1_13770 [soil metagenome]